MITRTNLIGNSCAKTRMEKTMHNGTPARGGQRSSSHSPKLTDMLRLRMLTDEPGVAEYPGSAYTSISVHVGAPVQMGCCRRGESHCGTAIHGDIDIIPAGTVSRWELKDRDTAFVMSVAPRVLQAAVEDVDLDPARLEIVNRFQMRDPQLEHIAWAALAEMEHGFPCGRLYVESLAIALAAQLVSYHSTYRPRCTQIRGGFSERKLKTLLAFIEENLAGQLSLGQIAGAAGMSVSHCTVRFRESVGSPIHQYVIRRRLERAVTLIREGKLPMSQIALESGFSHQSHLAMHMRRQLGVSPKSLRADLY
jgi:AraC family transcriptional regulator